MQKAKFDDVPVEQRINVLADNCDARREETYLKDLTQEELDIKRETITSNYIRLNDLDEELKDIQGEFKAKMNPLKIENKNLLEQIKTRKEKMTGLLFDFYEDGLVLTYDRFGEFVSSRRQTPEEKAKQAKLFIAHGATGSGE